MPLWTKIEKTEHIKGLLKHAELETHMSIYATYPSSKDLVDGSALLQSALCHYFGSHLLHIQHESIQRFLDMRPLVLFFLGRNGGFPANPKRGKKYAVSKP